MKKRIVAFLLAAVMVIGMLPTIAFAEESEEVDVYEALVATDVNIDGDLTESNWLTNGKLSGGQPFGILWDGDNLYFAVETEASDTELVVTADGETILTAGKNGANAIEAKAAYTTEGVTAIENVTLAVGDSTWTGNISLVKMAREDTALYSEMQSGLSGAVGTIGASADGNGLVFDMPAISAANQKIDSLYAMKNPTTALADRTGDVAVEFTFDPAALPVVPTSVVGVAIASWAGLEMMLVDGAGNGMRFAIANSGDNGLFVNVAKLNVVVGRMYLGRTVSDGTFDVKVVWKTDNSVEVFVNGVSVGTAEGVAATDAEMGGSGYTLDNMLHIRGYRYDYQYEYYKEKLNFTVSDIRLSKAVEVSGGSGEEPTIATGDYDAFVASDIVLDGAMTETAWLASGELGQGQNFDILFDGNNLYFGAEAFNGDTEMTVAIGDQTVATAQLGSGDSAFETSVEYLTQGITTIEDVTITVGSSVWNGDVTLVKHARVQHLTNSVLTTLGNTGGADKPVASGNGYAYSAAAGTDNTTEPRSYAMASGLGVLAGRNADMSVEFDFDPTGMVAHTYQDQASSVFATTAGFNAKIIDENKQTILFGMQNIKNTGLVFTCQTNVWGNRTNYTMNRTPDDGAFHVRLDWTTDDKLVLYVDGVYQTTFENRVYTNNESTTKAALFELWRYREVVAVPVAFKVTNIALSKAAEVTYVTDETRSDGQFASVFVDSEPTADSANWNYVVWERFANGSGKAAALVYDTHVYLAVQNAGTGTVTATLGSETETAALVNGAAVLCFDETAVSAYEQTFDVQVTVGETDAWTEDGVLTAEGKVLNAANSMPTNDAFNRASISGDTITFQTTDSVGNSTGAYVLQRKDLTDLVDINSDVLFEQDILIKSMSHGDLTGTFTGPVNNHGYTVMLEYVEGKIFSSVIAPADTEGNLSFYAYTSNATVKSLELGKKVGDSFKLGLLWGADGSTTVYVDNIAVGTVSNAAYAGSVYGTGISATSANILLKYQDAVCSVDNPAEIVVSRPVLTRLGSTKDLIPVEEEITQEAIFGSLKLMQVEADLPLITTFRTAYLGEVALRWTSSDETVVETDGTIHPDKTRDKNVTLSVYLGDGETALWSVTVTVRASASSLEALLATDTILVDGELNEISWINFNAISGTSSGAIASVWNKGRVYFAVAAPDDASAVELLINGTTVTVDLATGEVTGIEGATAAVGTVVEIALPLDALGVSLTDYNQSCSFMATMKGETDTAMTEEDMLLVFTGKVAQLESIASYQKTASFTVDGNTMYFDGKQTGETHYVFKSDTGINHAVDQVLSMDLQFDKLPVSNGEFVSQLQANGYYFWITEGISNGNPTVGDVVFGTIYNPDNTTLKLKIYGGASTKYAEYDLGVGLGEEFRLSLLWHVNGDVTVFKDGSPLGTAEDMTYRSTGCGYDCITYRYYNRGGNLGADVEFSVSNLSRVVTAYESVLDEITPKAVFGRTDLTNVKKNLPMTDTFSPAFFTAVPLTWVTSDASVITEDGVITRSEEARTATVTLYVNGIELWSVEITVASSADMEQPSVSNVPVAFTTAGIKLDGNPTDEGWLLNTKVLDSGYNLVGEFGAQWDEQYLYLAVDQMDAETVLLTIDDIEVPRAETAKSGTVTEYKIALSDLNVVADRYDIELPITVQLDDASFTGKLVLTSVDWWAAGNRYSSLPVADGMYKSIAYNGGNPTENQGVVEIENGWRMYDLYDEGGKNPVGVRSYVLFMRQALYDGFDDRSETMFVQFDFEAKSMPVYDEEMAKIESAAFANNGFTCSLADRANAQKYSNVCVFGIYNTEDGLVLAVKRNSVQTFPLNKQVGDLFRVGIAWQINGDAVIYIDGEAFCTLKGMSQWLGSVGDCSFVMNTVRSTDAAEKAEDSIDVYITNIAFGKQHSTNVLNTLTFDDFRGQNESEGEILYDLQLPTTIDNGQLSVTEQSVRWSSSHPEAIDPDTGKVTRPAVGGVIVTLTATLEDGSSKDFILTVIGLEVDNGNILIVVDDKNPAATAGVESDDFIYTFDASNNSIVLDLQESQTVNVVKLTDSDEVSRINAESLTLWVSEDNAAYTRVDSFKLLQNGTEWYLYDFEAEGRYVKVHYTHFDADESDFVGILADMIDAYDEEIFGANGAEFSTTMVSVTNESEAAWEDQAVELPGVTGDASVRVYLNGELLYHYVEDGKIIVRIPDLAAGETAALTVLTGGEGALDISNKENVYEVTYGTRESFRNNVGRWVLALEAGMKFPDGSVLEKDVLLTMASTIQVSYDGGSTWSSYANVIGNPGYDYLKKENGTAVPTGIAGAGGWIVDWNTGRLMYETYIYKQFSSGDISKSDCQTIIIFSDDGGKHWNMSYSLPQDYENDPQSTYVLSYSDGVMLSCYDGPDGENVDFVFNMGAQFNNNGAFCGRVAYSRDAGQTWTFSESLITFGNEYAFEGGVSECTILERDDGTLVLYARCQSDAVDRFAKSYSYDHGVTWVTPAESSTIYTVNTQPVMMKYDMDGDGEREAALMIWGGNNALGGESYMRVPLNIAQSTDGLENFRNIQNLFLETFMETYKASADHYITNPSAQQIQGDGFYVAFARLGHGDNVQIRVDDFVNWFNRTKGIYDSFEHGTAEYEGWETYAGYAAAVKTEATDGAYVMEIEEGSKVLRSVPYLQDGTLSMDLYLPTGGESFTVELQAAYSDDYNDTAPIGLKVVNGILTFEGTDTAITLNSGWNTIEFKLALTEGKAAASVNGSETVVPVNLTAGDYVCYIAINTTNGISVDNVLIVEETVEIAEPAEVAEFYGANMKLGNDLSMNFYIKAAAVAEAAYAEVTFKGETTVIEKEDWVVDGSYYKIAFSGMAAKEMTEEMTIQLFDADGNAVSELYTDSVRAYAMRILVKEAATDADKTLMVDMLNYGAAAQSQFAYKTDDLANALLSNEQKAYATESVELTNKLEAGENYYGTSLNLKTNIQMNVYFTNVTEDMTATITYTNHNGDEQVVEADVVMSGSYGKVTVESMVVADAYELLTIEVKDADGNVVASVVDSVESYCFRTMDKQPLNEYLMKFAYSAWKSFED